jgi:hypothetical protein
MQRRIVVVGAGLFIAVAVLYALVQMTEATPAVVDVVEAVEAPSSAISMKTVSSAVVFPSRDVEWFDPSIRESAILFATGATLIGIAAGVRRRMN